MYMFETQFFLQGRLYVHLRSRSVRDQQPFHQKDSMNHLKDRTRGGRASFFSQCASESIIQEARDPGLTSSVARKDLNSFPSKLQQSLAIQFAVGERLASSPA